MPHPEENLARDFHAALLEKAAPVASAELNGEAMSWSCLADLGNSKCDVRFYVARGRQYYTKFIRDSVECATSRIPSRDETVAAVCDWLDGCDLHELYRRHPFVDHNKRNLAAIREYAFATSEPLRTRVEVRFKNPIEDSCDLQFRLNDRSCKLYYYGMNPLPTAEFSWDGCQLFEYQPADHRQFVALLEHWLCDRAMPSQLRKGYPRLEIGELADYYERGNPIEGEFVLSWDAIENFYFRFGTTYEFTEPVLSMIGEMRKAGYDRVLRAGQSMYTLVLSRSRRHGLQGEQARIHFNFSRKLQMSVHADFCSANLERYPIRFSEDVQRLLEKLVHCVID